MSDLWWFDGLKADLLFVGCLEEHIASIERSNKGKKWSIQCELPGICFPKKWYDRFEARKVVEPLIQHWFHMTQTDRPATERGGE